MTQAESRLRFNWRDIAQIAVGACVMAFPVACTEEVWNLSKELSMGRALIIMVASLMFLGLFARAFHHDPVMEDATRELLKRVLSTYFVTLFICAALLFALDRLNLFEDPVTALKRSILVAFPACFAATVVDGLK